MKTAESPAYEQVRKAIEYIFEHYQEQPGLEQIASEVGLSSFHFQRLFTEWAGVSPKKFLQYVSVEQAKKRLREGQASLFNAAVDTGLSGSGRLHDLFIRLEGMTPGEYKQGGANLHINYAFYNTYLGQILVASTSKGICFMGFSSEEEETFADLKSRFHNASFRSQRDTLQEQAVAVLSGAVRSDTPIHLHVKGTDFQLKVWQTLLQIPEGELVTYGDIAHKISHPQANRAVGTAVGRNPVSVLIPCHRVLRSTGLIGDYHWGGHRKMTLIALERARKEGGG